MRIEADPSLQPDWFVGQTAFNSSLFASAIGGFQSTVAPPTSSGGWSGSGFGSTFSGGSMGGGFSGSGGGGGGGGGR